MLKVAFKFLHDISSKFSKNLKFHFCKVEKALLERFHLIGYTIGFRR